MPAGFRGRRSWLTLVVAVPALHVAVVVPQVSGKPAVGISCVEPMILTIVFFIATNALGRCWLKRCDRIKPDASAAVADQVALQGLLQRVRYLGLPLVSVTRVETDPPTAVGMGQADGARAQSEPGVGGMSTSTSTSIGVRE